MNLPNKLTVFRVALIPVFLVFFFMESCPGNFIWAFLVFATASVTDMLDGMIARKYGLVTDFGKLMDPLADKLLVMSALICLLQGSVINIVCLIVIMSREFMVTSIRLLAAGKGTVIAADVWGKLKTISQMVWISLTLLYKFMYENLQANLGVTLVADFLQNALFLAMLVLTVASGINYCWKNRHLFADA